MFKKTINLKVFELAIKKKDHVFLARHLIGHLREIGWTADDIADLVDTLERVNRRVDSTE